MHMERWLLEFPATVRKAALRQDLSMATQAMDQLQQHYARKTADERQTIYLSLARTILEDLDKDSARQVEGFLQQVGLLQSQKV
ncbi:MAG: hypothetical protein JO171_07215 [Paludibacterium sp.]|uniref:hypothetical protein n=1 Tax=Paludibacterium sp. TaxID=1917523 RepID=UPI0025E10195|nr:hypothetical protein [Paludibacterium sp.]MBV8046924.1 hypothetical protein [Paludibacterium sp.]MBV8646517.1 hypothetical protein [Paludibacterium sp.]